MAKVVTIRPAANPRSARVMPADAQPPPFENMMWIPGGTFLMGSERHYPEEAPVRKESVPGFWMDTYQLTNEDFARCYLCAANYCLRYRPAARIPQQVDTGTCHQGFRLIVRPKEAQPQSRN